MFQIADLQAGDIVLFAEGDDLSGPLPDIMGLVVDDHPDPHDNRAVLIQFYGGGRYQNGPLHYYHYELDLFLKDGTIRITHAP